MKTITAWAIVLKENNKIENADYFNTSSCDCCAGETNAMAVYKTKKDAEYVLDRPNYKIKKIKITI